ncbi:MAG: hypothetical protein AAFQ27_10050 [Pseudomonadota bacterium]
MDPDFAVLMTMIVLVTAISFIGANAIVSKVLDYKREKRQPAPKLAADTREIADRTDLVEDRLAVLERIATDRGQLLSDEIEQLRVETNSQEAKQS